ncbi:MAG: hypothetical protein D9V47_00040 [Clostridia bacterium]|nr:MAG: hypothetical protein D9V47_00040 [Clostridia bacterium]
MRWFRGSGYSVTKGERQEREEKVLAWQPRLPVDRWVKKYGEEAPVTVLPPEEKAKLHAALAPEVYTLAESSLPEFCLSLLNATDEESAVKHVQQYGLLGLLWAYREENTLLVDTRLAAVDAFPLEGKLVQFLLGISPQEVTQDAMRPYVEPLPVFLDAVKRFRVFAMVRLHGRQPKITLTAPVVIHYSAKGKPYWLPEATTPLEMAYACLPMLLAEGMPLRLCACGQFFLHCKKVRCPSCDGANNAAKQRKVRQLQKACRYVILRGMEVGEAAKTVGVPQERLLAWLERFKGRDAVDIGESIKTNRYDAIEEWQRKFFSPSR